MYSIRLEGDTRAMLRKIRSFSEIDKKGINAALAEGVRESTLERFRPVSYTHLTLPTTSRV